MDSVLAGCTKAYRPFVRISCSLLPNGRQQANSILILVWIVGASTVLFGFLWGVPEQIRGAAKPASKMRFFPNTCVRRVGGLWGFATIGLPLAVAIAERMHETGSPGDARSIRAAKTFSKAKIGHDSNLGNR